MAKLIKRNNQYILKCLDISNTDDLLLECGEEIEVSVSKVYQGITDNQRKFIFALINDICDYTGYLSKLEKESFRFDRMIEFELIHGMNKKSLALYDSKESSLFITYLINWCMDNDIPFNMEWIEKYQYQFDANQTYSMAKKRICCICGRRGSDIHHVDQIGTKGNRNKISHIGLRALPLCRLHHIEAHNTEKQKFLKKHNITPFVIDDKMEIFIKKGKVKVFKEDELLSGTESSHKKQK